MNLNEGLLRERYLELKESGQTEGFLDEKHFGMIKIYINKEPDKIMLIITIGEDRIYLGSD
jgi:hypothetical protein